AANRDLDQLGSSCRCCGGPVPRSVKLGHYPLVSHAHARHLSKSPIAIKPSAGCRAAALSSSAAHHGSGGGRSRSVTYGSSHSSAYWWISRQTRAPHLLCPPTAIVTTGSSAAIVTVRQRPVRAYPVSAYGVRRIGTRAAGSPLRRCSMRRRQSASASSETSSRYDRREWPVVSVTCSIQRATALMSPDTRRQSRAPRGHSGSRLRPGGRAPRWLSSRGQMPRGSGSV